MLKNNRGYTLPEVILATAIFLIIIMITANGFKSALTQVGQQSKLMETDIGSVIGLEVLRSDLQNAGYGLPWAFQATPASNKYTEVATSEPAGGPVSAAFWESGRSPRSFNDAATEVPRALQVGNTNFNLSGTVGSNYLVVKSLSVAPGTTQKKFVTVTYGDTGKSVTSWGSAERDFDPGATATERVVVIRNTFIDGVPTRQLQVNGGGEFTATFRNFTTLAQPHSTGDVFQVYGVNDQTDLRMPFNRADYYVSRPANISQTCAPNTGILYKAVLNQTSGYTEMPLLDCVADMQVVFGVGPVGSSEVNFHQSTLPGTGSAKDIREQLKEVRVYILAQQGKRDNGYSHPSSTMTVGESFGGSLLGRNFDLAELIGTDWLHYRWKVYTIVTRPQNLIQ